MSRSRSTIWGSLILVVGLLISMAMRNGWIDPGKYLVRSLSKEENHEAVIERLTSLAESHPLQLPSRDEFGAFITEGPAVAGGGPMPGYSAALAPRELAPSAEVETAGADAEGPTHGEFRVLIQLHRTGSGLTTSAAGRIISQSGILSLSTRHLNNLLVLPRNVPITVKSCGEANAFYYPWDSSIILCDELFTWMSNIFGQHYASPELDHAVFGATLFFVFHEVGHALIHLYNAPVLAAEEDAADALATILLAHTGLADAAFRGAESFALMAQVRNANFMLPFWDEHSLDEQRFYNIMCYLYAHDPGRFAFLVASGLLPLERASVCPSRYARTRQSAATILGPHLR